MGCLLTGIERFPGNIQGGGETPAGWSSGLSIDQEIKNHLPSQPETATRFGSLEFGVLVPNCVDTWTRMVYAGPNKPVAPIDDPYQMFHKLYGQLKDHESMQSVLDEMHEDLAKVAAGLPAEGRRILDEHTTLVRNCEKELARHEAPVTHAVPVLEQGIVEQNDPMPKISRMQIDLVVSSLADIPWVMIGGGLGFQMGRSLQFPGVPHNRLHLALAHAMGHTGLVRFGNPDYCGDGPLTGLV